MQPITPSKRQPSTIVASPYTMPPKQANQPAAPSTIPVETITSSDFEDIERA